MADPHDNEPAEDDEQSMLRIRLELDDDEPCPTVEGFEYALRVTPRRGWYEVEDGVVGVYDRKGEILTAIPIDFDPFRRVPCEECGHATVPMDLRCDNCGRKIDPSYVWSHWYGESDDEESTGESATDEDELVRLLGFTAEEQAGEVSDLLADAGVSCEIREEDDGEGNRVHAVWIDEIDLGTAQNVIGRPGVEG